ncbi:MAG TPA: FAD-dependent oxidoreductase, partial [Ignavibacteria bacterium]
MNALTLKHGFDFKDLFESDKLKELAEIFYNYYSTKDPESYQRYSKYKDALGEGFPETEVSKILIESGRHLDNFLIDFFGLEEEADVLMTSVRNEHAIIKVKSEFITRRVLKKFKEADLVTLHFKELDDEVQILKDLLFSNLDWNTDEENATATMIHNILEWEQNYKNHLDIMPNAFVFDENIGKEAAEAYNKLKISARGKVFTDGLTIKEYKNSSAPQTDKLVYEFIKNAVELLQKWTFAKIHAPEEKHKISQWILYKQPLNMDYNDLVHNKAITPNIPERMTGTDESLRRRDGFKLTDERYNNRQVMNEVEYCVFCHERNKDSCSKGFYEKDGGVKRNPLGIPLKGCPLDEKISEMHYLKYEGRSIGALGLIMIDNPMCPGTGHRICNDCMKACIYQKQEPVNIPQIETKVLTDVLELPYGFEIYSLLTRWNPLNVKRPYELPYNGRNVMVVGMGPAGYTLSQFLLNEGFAVVGVDGLKIEKVHPDLTGGRDENGSYIYPKPIKDFNSIKDDLDKRIFLGFGGVSEYGITVRWDKNFLKVEYLTLARRKYFKIFDGVRFGGTIEINDAWDFGFDHIAISSGAGKPTMVNMKNNLIRGTRQASDFLMALQLTGAAKRDSIANLMLQLPAVVIGGGLTAIDTATEAAAYYPVQVEKFLERYEPSIREFGEETVLSMYDKEEREIAKKFLDHGREVKAERKRAAEKGEQPNFVPLVRKWGGVTLCYRKSIQDSPAYRLNHEEIIKSLEEGIYYWEKMNPIEAVPNEYGGIKEIIMMKQGKNEEGKWIDLGETVALPASTVIVAAGTSPNVIYEREHPGSFELDERKHFFQTYKLGEDNSLIKTEKGEVGFFTSYNKSGRFITVYGDNHPQYAGNVVKAMASAKDGYKEVVKLFKENIREEQPLEYENKYESFIKNIENELIAVVEEVNILTPTIVEVVLKAPLQARKFHPGQFYRLQNYETSSMRIGNTTLMMEGLALTGAWVDVERGLLSLIILEMWGSSRLCRTLQKGEKVIVMGPTGAPTEIPKGETVLLAGGGLGNAVLFSVAKAMKMNGNKVVYFAGYRNSADLFKQDEVEEATDQVVWSNDFGDAINPRRPQDRTITANIVQAMIAYSKGELETNGSKPMFDLKKINRIIAIGSDRMMKAVKEAR